MSFRCKLISCIPGVPDQVINENESLVIGRNRKCKIKNLKCSKSFYDVELNGNQIKVTKMNCGDVQLLKNGDFISGPGFEYRIVIINQCAAQDIVVHKEVHWESFCSNHVYICHFRRPSLNTNKIAAFDFDGTLIKTKSGKTFCADVDDWLILDRRLPEKIVNLVNQGYLFVIISNQMGISKGSAKLEDIKKRFENVLASIGCPCIILIAPCDDVNRKPRIGLWTKLSELINCQIDKEKSFYVGDAAGRKSEIKGIKSDHSAVDLLFAYNLNLPFLTPEQFLQDKLPKQIDLNKNFNLKILGFNPRNFISNSLALNVKNGMQIDSMNNLINELDKNTHLIVFCGLPASGKSTFYSKYLKHLNYNHVSRDQLKTMDSCVRKAERHLIEKQNCVIDNTNLEVDSRLKWIQLARKHDVNVYLFHFDVSLEHALHNNLFRKLQGAIYNVSEILIRSFNKKFVMPTADEGFTEIYKINFVPHFNKTEDESLYKMMLCER